MNDLTQQMTLADLMQQRQRMTHQAMPESKRTLADLMRGGLMGVTTDVLGAPVDLATLMMRPFGYQHQKPVGGSDWLASKLTRPTGSKEETGARMLSGLLSPDPSDLLKLAPLMLGATVFHGSPHKFDKFDLSKIGTGEGAQAYGHGIYLADSPGVADEYAGKLSEPVIEFLNKAPETELEKEIYKRLLEEARIAQYGSRLSAVNRRWQNMSEPTKDILYGNSYAGIKPLPQDQLDKRLALRDAALALGSPKVSDKGHFYHVDLPDEAIAKMLDWDNTIPEPQREQLSKAMVEKFGSGASSSQGESVWKSLVWEFKNAGSKTPEHDASRFLKEIGIPGIRYLDGGSRSAGKGTSNYVVFDDSLLKILKRE